jgi:hypothetical protein
MNSDTEKAEETVPTSAAVQKVCGTCHKEQVKFWSYGGHVSIPCHKCHNVRGDHEEEGVQPKLPGNRRCLECHPLVKGPQKEPKTENEVFEHHLLEIEKKHVIRVNRKKVGGRCIYCHDPHLGQ